MIQHRPPALSVLALTLNGLGLSACVAQAAPHGPQPQRPPATARPTESPQAEASPSAPAVGPTPTSALKAPLVGVVDRQGVPAANNPKRDLVTGVVVNLDWSAIEEVRGHVRYDVIDGELQKVDQFSREVGHPVGVRLRIVGGIKAPDWAKRIGGDPVRFDHVSTGDKGADDVRSTIGRFWTAEYGQAYAQTQVNLAARYDSDQRINDVVISRCATIWSEPYVRQSDDGVRKPLLSAGYTTAADLQCYAEQIQAHQVWKHTPSTLSLNPYQKLTADLARPTPDMAATLNSLNQCRKELGERCVLANNSIRDPLQEDYVKLYEAIRDAGHPLTFQTAKSDRIGSLPKTLDWAAQWAHACSVELPTGYQRDELINRGQLASASKALAANCPS